MNNIFFDIMQNVDSGYTSTASKEAYKRYFAQKAASIDFDIKINIDEEAMTQSLETAIRNSGGRIE